MVKIPVFPLSVLVFYTFLTILWSIDVIPSTQELVLILEKLFEESGYFWLTVAAFVEGIAYICLYVPGAFVIAFSVFLSDHSFFSLLKISGLVATTLTLAAFIDYQLGKFVASKKVKGKKELIEKSKRFSKKGLFSSLLHPNLMAFYFFNAGLGGKNIKQIMFVPLFMFPYGLLIAYLLSTFADQIKNGVESSWFILSILMLWVLISFWKDNKKARLRFLTFSPSNNKRKQKG